MIAAATAGANSDAAAQLPPPPPPPLGAPLPGLGPNEFTAFQNGQQAFLHVRTIAEGLGPVFNGRSCAACHRAGAAGGASTDLGISRVTRIAGIVNGTYNELQFVGGPVLQARSLRELDPTYPFPGETIPVQANFVSRRITTPLFGAGLIEAIPEATIVANSQRVLPDGVHGVPNRIMNPQGVLEVGRFGWKSQVARLGFFSGDAYLNEIGLTSQQFPRDNLPQGRLDPAGRDKVADPEDVTNAARAATDYMRFLAPPPPTALTLLSQRGQQVFASIRCTSCHIPVMQTGLVPSPTLSNKPARLYSDLLLHRMGPALADGVRQGQAFGDQWRTAPLWGLRFRPVLMHDGRATTPEQAVMMHGGEAQIIRDRYAALPLGDKSAVLEFLKTL